MKYLALIILSILVAINIVYADWPSADQLDRLYDDIYFMMIYESPVTTSIRVILPLKPEYQKETMTRLKQLEEILFRNEGELTRLIRMFPLEPEGRGYETSIEGMKVKIYSGKWNSFIEVSKSDK